MNCRNCGEIITEEMEFCKNCGLHLKYVSYHYTRSEVDLQSIFRNPGFYLRVAGFAIIFMMFLAFIYINQTY